MKATVDGVVYEGTEEEIRSIVENPPNRPPVRTSTGSFGWPPGDYARNPDGSPRVTCEAGKEAVQE